MTIADIYNNTITRVKHIRQDFTEFGYSPELEPIVHILKDTIEKLEKAKAEL